MPEPDNAMSGSGVAWIVPAVGYLGTQDHMDTGTPKVKMEMEKSSHIESRWSMDT